MIKGVHAMFYTSEPVRLRRFIRDKLGLPYTDTGGGWWIFALPEADMGCHPVDSPRDSGIHDISFYCDDLEETVKTLRRRRVKFDDEICERSYGKTIHFTMPGGVKVQLYQPFYQLAKKKVQTRLRAASRTVRKRTVKR